MAQRMNDHPELLGLPVGSLEDKDLTLAFQAGDKGAYQAIYDRYSRRVESVCRRMLGNPQDAQEAAQESFLRVYQALGRFNGRYQLGPWITRIATNVCLDQIRARARRPSDMGELDVIDLDHDRHHDAEGPEFLVMRNAEGRRVRKVLAELPPLHRAAIVLRDFEGLSYSEIAVVLGMTDCQVKALIHRARQNFKRSWTRSLSVLLPWRLIERLRGIDGSVRDHSVEAVTVVQSVSSCTSMLQQCGQYVGQHVATVVTAALVGTVAGAASHAATKPARPDEVSRPSSAAASKPAARSGSYKLLSQTTTREAEAEATKAKTQPEPPEAEVVASGEPTPTEEPTPAPTPTTPTETPTPTATPAAEPSPSPSASPKAAPQPFAPAVGFDFGRPVPGRTPRSHSATVSCTKNHLEQRLETVVEDDDSAATYPALLLLHWGASTSDQLSLELTVWKNGKEIYYSGRGALTDGSQAGSEQTIKFLGEYGTFSPDAKTMDLPTSGDFQAALTLDCAALTVITESVVLGT